jgi:peptide/nickel transport system permease protein
MRRRQWLGLAILALLASFAILTPWWVASSPIEQNLSQSLLGPSGQHWLGTDVFGRDQAVRLAFALRLSLVLALLTVSVAAAIGIVLGLAAAAWGGRVDQALTALCEICMSVPGLLLVLMIVAFAPGQALPIFIGLVLSMWVEYFRVVRATASTIWSSAHVESARLAGMGLTYIARWHVWPSIAPVLITMACYGAVAAVLAVSALGFASVGVRPPTPELGLMLVELLPYYLEAPWLIGSALGSLWLFLTGLVLLADRGES